MNELTSALNLERNPTDEEASYIAIGISAAQTSYELNNGTGVKVGYPLKYIDDGRVLTLPGSRPLKMVDLDGFTVRGVFNNSSTGLNAFLAVSQNTGVVIIGLAGTNGFGKDWPDSKSDLVRLGVDQSLELLNNENFISALEQAVISIGGVSNLTKLVIAGQSLGGGIAPTIGLGLVNASSNANSQNSVQQLEIPAEKIFTVSFNGFGNEYSSQLAGFSQEQIDRFNQQASLHRIVIKNVKTDEFDLVSQLGGDFSGTDWILPVEVANGLGPLHRFNFGGADCSATFARFGS